MNEGEAQKTQPLPVPGYLKPLLYAVSLLCLAGAGIIARDFVSGVTGGGFHLVRNAPIFEADGLRYTLASFGEGLGTLTLLALSFLMLYLAAKLTGKGNRP